MIKSIMIDNQLEEVGDFAIFATRHPLSSHNSYKVELPIPDQEPIGNLYCTKVSIRLD